MANPCRICSNSDWSDRASDWARQGASDREVARRLGIDKSLVTRHRQRHILAPLRHQLAIAGKGDIPRRERTQLAQVAAADTPTPGQITAAFLSLDGIATDLRLTCDRLERQASGAEQDGQRGVVAALSQAQIRSAETRARLSGIGAYAPSRITEVPAKEKFSIVIQFSSGRSEEISVLPSPTTIDGEVSDEDRGPPDC
jgi:hypothetical protein